MGLQRTQSRQVIIRSRVRHGMLDDLNSLPELTGSAETLGQLT